MHHLLCTTCGLATDYDESPDACPHCDGHLIASSVYRDRQAAEADAIDRAFDAYHDRQVFGAEPTYPAPGFLRIKQAS